MNITREVLNKIVSPGHKNANWYVAPNGYELHADVIRTIEPKTYVEIGTYYGYSTVAALTGYSIEQIVLVDNEDYEPDSLHAKAIPNIRAAAEILEIKCTISATKNVDDIPSLLNKIYEPMESLVTYIDGEHTYNGKIRDLNLALSIGSWAILVDDYVYIDACRDAVNDWLKDNKIIKALKVPTFRGMALLINNSSLVDKLNYEEIL